MTECGTKGKSGAAACAAVKDCEWKMNQQGQMSCAVSAAYTRNLVFGGMGGGDACKGMNALLDTTEKCMGMAKDACPSSDCEWKEKDSECTPPSNFMATVMADKDMGEYLKKTSAVAAPCGGVRVASRSVSPPWGSIRFRLALRTHAPCGPSVRVVSQTKSRKIPTRNMFTALARAQVQTSAACSAAGDVCEWATDFGKESLAEKCGAAPLPIIKTLGCGGGLNKRFLAFTAKGMRADAAKVQERATAATAKVAEVKAKLTACSNCTTVELTSIQAEVKDAESQEAKLVKAVSESKTAAEAAEQTAADSTARALASCAAAVLASLLAGLMAF